VTVRRWPGGEGFSSAAVFFLTDVANRRRAHCATDMRVRRMKTTNLAVWSCMRVAFRLAASLATRVSSRCAWTCCGALDSVSNACCLPTRPEHPHASQTTPLNVAAGYHLVSVVDRRLIHLTSADQTYRNHHRKRPRPRITHRTTPHTVSCHGHRLRRGSAPCVGGVVAVSRPVWRRTTRAVGRTCPSM